SLAVKEAVGDRREVAVTQVGLADVYRMRGNYAMAENLYQASLAICQSVHDLHSVYAILMRLGQLALDQERREEALPLLREARAGFAALGLAEWVAAVDQLLAQAERNVLTLDDVIALVQAARNGDHAAGEKAWAICEGLARSGEATLTALGRALRAVLSGEDPAVACAALPEDLRAVLLAAL
ncbi:MAG TPA: tetratricopeptide repeat protein, partial [Anaerolineae bacterium]|nr:tetratricopeptide repeat protein [Anaerolineae bacterium]